VLIAQAAVGLTDQSSSSFEAGPLGRLDVPIAALLTLAAIATVLTFSLQTATAWQSAALTSGALAESRKDIMRWFLEASWGLQSTEREGQLQELATTYASTAGDAMLRLVTLVAGLFTLLALLASALALNVAAAITAAAAVAAL